MLANPAQYTLQTWRQCRNKLKKGQSNGRQELWKVFDKVSLVMQSLIDAVHTAEEVLMNGGQVRRLVKFLQSELQQKKTMQSAEEISKIYRKGDLGEEFPSKWCQLRQCKVKREESKLHDNSTTDGYSQHIIRCRRCRDWPLSFQLPTKVKVLSSEIEGRMETWSDLTG